MLCIKESSWMSDKFKKRNKKGMRRSHTEQRRNRDVVKFSWRVLSVDFSLKANLHQTPSPPISFRFCTSQLSYTCMDTAEPMTENYKDFLEKIAGQMDRFDVIDHADTDMTLCYLYIYITGFNSFFFP